MNCRYCRWRNDRHDPDCPRTGSSKMAIWNRGESDGRAGKEPAESSKIYMMGWGVGNVTLEEAENGFDPVHEGRQW